MLERWLSRNVGGDTRLLAIRIRALFGGFSETQIVNLLDLFQSGVFPMGSQPALAAYWEGIFLQLSRTCTGMDAFTVFREMMGPEGLTGAQLKQFWTTSLNGGGGSELLVRAIQPLVGAGLTGTQISTLIGHFLDNAHRITLTRQQVATALGHLRPKLTGTQALTLCNFFQTNLPAGIHNYLANGVSDIPVRFLAVCDSIRQSVLPAGTIMNLMAAHGTLTAANASVLLFCCDLDYVAEFINTALPGTITLPGGVANTGGDLLGYAEGRGNISQVKDVMANAHATTLPVDRLAYFLCHLRLMAAGDRVARLASFINDAYAARRSKNRNHSWTEIKDLVHQFVTDLRPANGPGGIGARTAQDRGRCHCPAERVTYFLKAHTYRFLDFSLVGRTKDDITFFPAAMTAGNMETLVYNVLGAIGAGAIDDAADSEVIRISTVNYGGSDYEIGLKADRNIRGDVALMHFMPYTVDPADFWHKDLLTAIGKLF
jgi:hypothetical protein